MKRLDYLLSFIAPNGNVIADIGTDHAYLPIKAMEEGKAKIVYAVDISRKALVQAQNNLLKQRPKISNAIKLIQANGFEFLAQLSYPKIDYAVISGLGSSTIYDIINKPHSNVARYLIISNNEISKIRHWAKNHNFEIEQEDFFNDNNHHYWLILINSQKTNQQLKTLALEFGDWKKWYQKNLIYRDYLSTLHHLHLKYQSKIKDPTAKRKNENYVKRIEKYLKQWN